MPNSMKSFVSSDMGSELCLGTCTEKINHFLLIFSQTWCLNDYQLLRMIASYQSDVKRNIQDKWIVSTLSLCEFSTLVSALSLSVLIAMHPSEHLILIYSLSSKNVDERQLCLCQDFACGKIAKRKVRTQNSICLSFWWSKMCIVSRQGILNFTIISRKRKITHLILNLRVMT